MDAAAQLIARGGILAYPTEGVYGIGCDPGNAHAVQRLLAIKSRDINKGLILIAARIEQLSPWIAPLSAEQLNAIGDSWPGPVTWVVPAQHNTPAQLTGGRPTLAARVSAHPPVAALCLAAGTALVSTSANLSGQPPAREASQLDQLSGVDAYLEGPTGGLQRATPIFDLASGATLRS